MSSGERWSADNARREAGVFGFWVLGFAFALALQRVAGNAPRRAVEVNPGL